MSNIFYYARYFRFYLLYWLQMTKPHITRLQKGCKETKSGYLVAPVVVYARNPSSMSVMSLGLMPRRTHYKLGIGSAGGNRTQHFHLERVRTWPISRQHHVQYSLFLCFAFLLNEPLPFFGATTDPRLRHIKKPWSSSPVFFFIFLFIFHFSLSINII